LVSVERTLDVHQLHQATMEGVGTHSCCGGNMKVSCESKDIGGGSLCGS
jgi:hypothetical protein